MRNTFILFLLSLLLGACSALNQAIATPTVSPSATPSPTYSPAPSQTPSPSDTPGATATPSPRPTVAATATFTATSTPTITPFPAVGLVFDNWTISELPQTIKDGISNPLIAFLNANNRQSIANIATALPNTGVQTLYFVSPSNPGNRVPILEINSSTSLNVFLAKNGEALAYVKKDDNFRGNGLYIMDLSSGFSARMLPGDNPLVQRGIIVDPDWSPDGSQLAVTVATGYDLDIFLYAKDGSGRANITEHGAFDFWPRWSPDGRFLAFVSDRERCPSWIPGDAEFCDASKLAFPSSGQVYLIKLATGSVSRVSDIEVAEPPYWISDSLLAFASGDPFDLLNPQRRIWQTNIDTGRVMEVRLDESPERASYLSEAWSPDGRQLLVQIADQVNELVLMTRDGRLLRRDNDLDFPRYAMSAQWSPDGQRLAIGGSAGQCPYGIRVKAADYRNVATGDPPPSMCDPVFSPDSQHIAFSGVNPRVDGRNDVFVANNNGFGAINLTANLRGQVELLGWVGGSR